MALLHLFAALCHKFVFTSEYSTVGTTMIMLIGPFFINILASHWHLKIDKFDLHLSCYIETGFTFMFYTIE